MSDNDNGNENVVLSEYKKMEISSTKQAIYGLNDLNRNSLTQNRKTDSSGKEENIDTTVVSQINKMYPVSEDMGADTIKQLRSQLQAGEFDSPEAIRAAAENIYRLGI